MKSKINLDFEKINNILNNGGVIAFASDTVWGLGCLPENRKAVNKIYEIKGRDRTKPLGLMSNDIKYLLPYTKNMTKKAEELIKKYFPGALTVITEKSDLAPDFLTAGKNTIGLRVPGGEFCRILFSGIKGHVLASTSANKSGEPPAVSYEETVKAIGRYADIVLEDFGFNCSGAASTVVSAVNEDIKVLRRGGIII